MELYSIIDILKVSNKSECGEIFLSVGGCQNNKKNMADWCWLSLSFGA